MSEQRTPFQAGDIRQFDQEHAARLHLEIVVTIDRFISTYPNTLQREIFEALRSVRAGYEEGLYPSGEDIQGGQENANG